MKYRIHKRVETKPDGRTIYYYTFEPAETQEHETSAEPDPEMLAAMKATHARLEAAGHLHRADVSACEYDPRTAQWLSETPSVGQVCVCRS